MSKPTSNEPRKAEPESEWLVFAIRKVPGTYEQPGGWALRTGIVPEGRVPGNEEHAPNLFAIVLAKMEHIASWYRDHRA